MTTTTDTKSNNKDIKRSTKQSSKQVTKQEIKLAEVSLDDKYKLNTTRAYITGIEALVRLPMLQHQRDQERGLNTAGFVSGYRGSPLGGVDQAMWKAKKYLDEHNITFVPGINEDLAATAVRGSQEVGLMPGSKFDGVFGMWYGKGPGLDRSIDAIRHANAAGTSKWGGVLAVVGDDHGCKSSTYPYQSEHLFMSLSMPVLAPANVQEVLDLGVYGIELSRYCGCWVGLKAITENMDSAVSAKIDPNRIEIKIPKTFHMPDDGVNVRWPDTPLAQEERLNKYKIYAARVFARENNLNKIVMDTKTPKLGIITSGKSYLDVLQAFDDLGIDKKLASELGIRVYKVGMPWPLEPVTTHEFAEGLDEILVVEEKRSVMEDQLTGQLYNWPVDKRPKVVGEYDEHGQDLLTNLAELTPAMIARVIFQRITPYMNDAELINDSVIETMQKRVDFINRKERKLAKPRKISNREAMYCSGCPHNTSTAVPEGSIAGGGIGCHYMSTWSKNRPAHNYTHMGGEGVTWTGIAPFTETKHMFQNLGDGTYFHSGLLAIRQSVASGVNITYKILYNDAVAMTGGQPVDGNLSVAQLVLQLKGEGIQRIEIVSDNPKAHKSLNDSTVSISHRDQLNLVQKSLRETTGTTILIYEQTCAAEKRRRRKRGIMPDIDQRVVINEAVCEGCGDCSVKSNCMSVIPKETEVGRKRQIDQAACNKDFSCINGFCPSFVSVAGGELKKNKESNISVENNNLPEPTRPLIDQPWNILVTGIGGTGVLTVTSVLSMAAHLENKGIATLNQTGLAQKFGPVISHLRIANEQKDIHAVRIPAGDADVMIGCDLIVSASDDALAKLNVERSHAVINDTLTPTAEFVHNPDAVFQDEAMKHSIIDELKEGRVDFLPATEIANALLGDTIATNLFMLGYAYQKGLIPVSSEAIFKALELNKVRIDFNKKAFMWGRMALLDRKKVEEAANVEKNRFTPLEDLEDIIEYRANDLVGYQDEEYAQRYRNSVNAAKEVETAVMDKSAELDGHENSLLLTKAVAKVLYKVMAYKDEYEVARLYTDGRFKKQIEETFEGDTEMSFYFAMPLISKRDPDTGHLVKRKYGAYMLPVLKNLAKLKRFRGTKFDLLGKTAERQVERQMITDVNNTISTVLKTLNPGNLLHAIEIIELANDVRGYGHVKEANYEQYQLRLAQQLKSYENGTTFDDKTGTAHVVQIHKVDAA
ncbi:indolepyruvate ferredoxin oxidoreductase family protein [Cocleimonas flava]|uniref:Indolepyruvate ferredoxin oxidoreductase n=1 Tax=Cocleimonas flava TaxID=634765 RepID=A0A4R1EX24_9GAMM|nr:indolepyruvate ferredoxin oxidoreductase family protein [Cocleimonas flava]TCJ84524.1 indolepyruvate ferredoxin oxidoreductase [Cocleimonas flava]